jgi:hypothetical protein
LAVIVSLCDEIKLNDYQNVTSTTHLVFLKYLFRLFLITCCFSIRMISLIAKYIPNMLSRIGLESGQSMNPTAQFYLLFMAREKGHLIGFCKIRGVKQGAMRVLRSSKESIKIIRTMLHNIGCLDSNNLGA